MTNWHRSLLLRRIKHLEIQSKYNNNSILIIDTDENGLYGEQGFTEKELDQYIQRKGYEVVIIDDISLMGE